jgi:myo-inositol-1(or 4)-monophosphatase
LYLCVIVHVHYIAQFLDLPQLFSPIEGHPPVDTAAEPSHGAFAALAQQLASVARQHTLPLFRTLLTVTSKADASPVTIADRSAEAAMRGLITEHFPAHGIYGEEHGQERIDAPYLWVLDPIDGTKSFITGSPLWGTLVALLHHGQPVIGLVDMPMLGETWLAQQGQATLCNGRPVHTSDCRELQQARIYTTSPDAFGAADWAAFDALSRRCSLRRFGGDCYSYAQLAGGHIDLVVEAGLQPYDYLPMVALLQSAGGVISDWQGQPLSVASDGRVLAAASAELHAQALAGLQR